jgi:hypothetical protein
VYSRDHFLISVAVGIVLVFSPLEFTLGPVAVVVLAAAVGTAIDLDHFVIARIRTGSWRAVRRGFERPRRFVLDQSELFEEGDVGVIHRLLSHALLGGVAVVALAALRPDIALVVAVAVYAHVVADLVAGVRTIERVVTKPD